MAYPLFFYWRLIMNLGLGVQSQSRNWTLWIAQIVLRILYVRLQT